MGRRCRPAVTALREAAETSRGGVPEVRCEDGGHGPRGPGAVRDSMLLRGAVLAECPAARRLGRRLEEWVVPEPAGADETGRDPAAGCPSSRHDLETPATPRRCRQSQGQHADVARAASLGRQAVERDEELGVVLGVRRGLAGVTAGPDPRAGIEGVDLEPRVVGKGRQTGRSGGEAGLDPGVRLEGEAVLDRVTRDPELVEGDEVQVVEPFDSEQLPELAQLVGRAGCDDEPAAAPRRRGQRRTVASAAACASNSRVRPVWARSSRASTRARSNGLPSAVPWSST